MHSELELRHACRRLRLAADTVLHCQAGQLWLTSETRADTGPSPDTVLQAGQQFRVAAAGDYFLTHLRGSGPAAHCRIEFPVMRRGWRWVFSLR